jgi:hypothetical protein
MALIPLANMLMANSTQDTIEAHQGASLARVLQQPATQTKAV